MRIKEGFILRSICGEYVVLGEGLSQVNFNKMLSLNESAAYLWQKVEESESFTVADLVNYLLEEYEVDAATAEADAANVVKQWLDAEIIEE